MAATAGTASSSHLLLSSSRHVAASPQPRILFPSLSGKRVAVGKNHHATGVRCMAVAADATAETKPAAKKKSGYELQTLTSWLLRQEMKGEIDTELTIVMSSIAMASGYCMYSSSVIFVLTLGKGVFAFTLDPMYGEFVLTQENIEIPKAGKIYSFNEGNYQMWDENLKKYIDDLKDPGPSGKPYSARYIGSLVGDFHRTLLYGGIYGYPRDAKSKNGKLRLLYECAPMSFIVEQAGGKGSDGHQRVLDIQPTEIHQRVPLYIGSKEEVEKLEKYLA
ncbi:hypothetical protein BRARA_D00490 [Brassica rapa]|uniref:fructose-bisphosphatase n=1 Tax=Brassica campestris TaxID=3711 RepID=A0A397ZRM2_BRACM|nr:hypothetical protein BRARA_D00490 [Brassica rapa]